MKWKIKSLERKTYRRNIIDQKNKQGKNGGRNNKKRENKYKK